MVRNLQGTLGRNAGGKKKSVAGVLSMNRRKKKGYGK